MIGINNLTANPLDEKLLKRIAESVLKEEDIKEGSLSIVLVGAGRMRALNKRYRKKNRVTDVLSFERSNRFPSASENEIGEIVICLQQVKKNAKKFNLDYNKELSRVLIHGILHLLGYDHETEKKEADKMKRREDYYLGQI